MSEVWPVKQRTHARTGNATDRSGPEQSYTTNWQFTVDGWGNETRVKSSPVFDGETVYFGAKDGGLYAVNISSGTVEWVYDMNDQSAWGAPALTDDMVVIGSFDNYIHAVDKSTGRKEWVFETEGQVRSSVGLGSVDSGRTRQKELILAGSRDGHLYAISASTGHCEWQFEADGEVRSTPAVDTNTVYFGCEQNNIYALDLADGTEQWRTDGPGSGTLAAVRRAPAVANGRLFVTGYSYFSDLHALNKQTGARIWTYEVDDRIDSSPAIVDGTVYFGARDEQIHAVDAATGIREWTFSVDDDVESSPVVTAGTVYVGCNDNTLYALDRETGKERWAFDTEGKVTTSPAVSNKTLLVSSFAGVYSLVSDDTKVYSGSKDSQTKTDTEIFETTRTDPRQGCSNCGADLSGHTGVNFCPECGAQQ